MSERRACRLVKQPRGTQRYQLTQREDEDALTQAIVELASQYGRYGYRRIAALLKRDGWQVGKDRVERIWRREGLKVPQRQKPRGRLWFNDGSCVRLRPEHANHVWSYDFVSARTHDGRTVRMLHLIDEHSRECLMIRPGTPPQGGRPSALTAEHAKEAEDYVWELTRKGASQDAAKHRAAQKFGCSRRTIDRLCANRGSDPEDKPTMAEVIALLTQ